MQFASILQPMVRPFNQAIDANKATFLTADYVWVLSNRNLFNQGD